MVKRDLLINIQNKEFNPNDKATEEESKKDCVEFIGYHGIFC